MARVRVYLACSLDGYVAGPGDDLSWLPGATPDGVPAEEQTGGIGFADFMADIGVILMGRTTFDVVAGFDGPWPYPVPVLVATHRPLEAPEGAQVTAVAGGIEALLEQARAIAGARDVYLDGGALVRQALSAGLVDQLVLTVVPTVLASGALLWAGLDRTAFALKETHRFSASMVQWVLVPKETVA